MSDHNMGSKGLIIWGICFVLVIVIATGIESIRGSIQAQAKTPERRLEIFGENFDDLHNGDLLVSEEEILAFYNYSSPNSIRYKRPGTRGFSSMLAEDLKKGGFAVVREGEEKYQELVLQFFKKDIQKR
ncbi:MAG: hypothetical protein MRY49_01090 [Candidatus Pacebacteria bacterium]|nr:hypothetical protein [Candidatus Paceibacterota bacterium]